MKNCDFPMKNGDFPMKNGGSFHSNTMDFKGFSEQQRLDGSPKVHLVLPRAAGTLATRTLLQVDGLHIRPSHGQFMLCHD